MLALMLACFRKMQDEQCWEGVGNLALATKKFLVLDAEVLRLLTASRQFIKRPASLHSNSYCNNIISIYVSYDTKVYY